MKYFSKTPRLPIFQTTLTWSWNDVYDTVKKNEKHIISTLLPAGKLFFFCMVIFVNMVIMLDVEYTTLGVEYNVILNIVLDVERLLNTRQIHRCFSVLFGRTISFR